MITSKLPQDPHLLLSMVNMKLRNDFVDLDDLIHDYQIEKADLINALALQGYVYNDENNQFVHKHSIK